MSLGNTMKVDEKLLLQAVKVASTAVSQRPVQPVLGTLLMRADDATLKLTGFDLKTHITAEIACSGGDTFERAVHQKLFADLIAKLQSEPIGIKATSSGLSISHGNSDYNISCMDADEYPLMLEESITDWYRFEILDFAAICLAAEFASHTTSSDATKQVLQGINFTKEKGIVSIAATDGHRLSVIEVEDTTLPDDIAFTLDTDVVKPLKMMIEEKAEFGEIGIGKNVVGFRCGQYQIISRLIDGQFPVYRQLIPAQFLQEFEINPAEMHAAISRMLVVAPPTSVVGIEADGEEIVIASKNEMGNGKEYLSCNFTKGNGEGMKFAANGLYLIDSLNGLKKSDTASIHFNSQNSPVVFRGGAKLILIMPVQLRE